MIQVLFSFLALLLLTSPSLSQRSSGRLDTRRPRNKETWLMYGMVFNHRVSPPLPGPNTPLDADKHPPLWAQFYILRSKLNSDNKGLFWDYLPNTLAVYCQHDFQLADLEKNMWGSCDSYKEAAVGEEQLSQDTKSRLKWRMLDYKTNKNNASPFESITIQIVNTLHPRRYIRSSLVQDSLVLTCLQDTYNPTPPMVPTLGRHTS